MAVLAFYESYCARSLRSQKVSELWPIAVKSVKFAIACLLTLGLFIISHILCRRYHISFIISFIISVLIALGFLGFCRLFNIKNPASSDVPERRAKKKEQDLLNKSNKDTTTE